MAHCGEFDRERNPMRKSTKLLVLALGFLAGIAVLGCKKTATTGPTAPPLTGACNAADSAMYQTLIFSQGSLLNLKSTLAASTTDPKTVSTLTPYYNQAKTDYNLAEASWQVYHATCMANPSAPSTTAQAAVNKLSSDIQSVPAVTK